MANDLITSTIEGTVDRVGGYGFTLDGRDGWLNLSKFADPKPQLPEEGSYVTVGLDKGGFVRQILTDRASPAAQRPPTPKQSYDNQPAVSAPAGNADRETRITRLACLKAAVDWLASNTDSTTDEVCEAAAVFEEWVSR